MTNFRVWPAAIGAIACILALAASPARGAAQAASRFTVGGRDLVRVDFASTPIGQFPSSVEMVDGIMDVVAMNGRNMLRASSRSVIRVPLPQVLPEDFTLAFEIIPKAGGNPEDLAIEGTPLINQGANSANVMWHRDYLQIVGGGATYDSKVPPSFAATLPSVLTQVVLTLQGETMKLYTNGRLMFTQSNRKFTRGRVLRVFLGGQDDGPNAVYLASLHVVNGVAVGPVATASSTSGGTPGAGAAGAGAAGSPPSQLPPSQNPLPNVGPSGGGASSGTAPVSGTTSPNPAGTTGSGTTLNPGVTRGTSTAMNTAPAAGNLSVTGQPLQARISWAAAPGATRYALRRAFTGTTTWTTVVDQGAPITDAVDVLPDHRRTYTYELFAYQSDGTFGSATASYTPPAPKDPTGFVATIIGPGEIKFDWNNVMDAHFRLDGPGAGSGIWIVGMNPDPAARFTHTLKGIPVGTHTWSLASVYHPGGVMTAANAWPTASATVTAPDPAPRYRLTALGVRALNQSADNIFAVDGMGDEVYVAAVINSTTRAFVGTNLSTATSATYGDVGTANAFPGRNRAGTYGTTGGIKSGDLIPISLNLANPTGTPNILGFPLILWEGVLDDNAMVVVEPSLWEEDSDKALYTAFIGVASSEATKGYPSTSSTISTLRDQGQVGPAVNTYTQGQNVLWCCRGVEPDRPIGLELFGSTPFLPHRVVVLTKVAVESALNMPGQRAGSAPGVIIVPLEDRATAGTPTTIYELYLRLERVP